MLKLMPLLPELHPSAFVIPEAPGEHSSFFVTHLLLSKRTRGSSNVFLVSFGSSWLKCQDLVFRELPLNVS